MKTGNFIKERCVTIGTGQLVLDGALPSYATFAASASAGMVFYSLREGDNREIGLGTFNGSNYIQRTQVIAKIEQNVFQPNPQTPLYLNSNAVVACSLESGYLDLVEHSNRNILDAITEAFLIADRVKLDGVEPLADVTDAQNVAAAGAVMYSDGNVNSANWVSDDNTLAANSNAIVTTQKAVKFYIDKSVHDAVIGAVPDHSLANIKFAQVLHHTIKGRQSSGTGDVEDWYGDQFLAEVTLAAPNIAIVSDSDAMPIIDSGNLRHVEMSDVADYATTAVLLDDPADDTALPNTGFLRDQMQTVRDRLKSLKDAATKSVGTSAGEVAAGDHNHSGVYEPANPSLTAHLADTTNPHSVTKAQVGLDSVTNNAQTKASIVPNTAPSAGQVLIGSGTAYAKQTLSGDATLSAAGALTLANTPTARANIGLGNVTNDTQTKATILPNTSPSAGQIPVGSGTAYVPKAMSGDATLSSAGALTLGTSGVTAASYGPSANATLTFGGTFSVPQITYDAKGRATVAYTRTMTMPANPGGGSHNSLTGLQGGTSGQYYHLTSTQSTDFGLITTAGWTLVKAANAAAQKTALSLNNVTNNSQAYASIYDNTAPAKGQVLVGNGSIAARQAAGTNGYVLTADSTQTNGVKWAAVSGGSGLGVGDMIQSYGVLNTPDWLKCDGSEQTKSTYPVLGAMLPLAPAASSSTQTIPTSQNWVSVAADNVLFVAVADGTSGYATSSDGTSWTNRTFSSSLSYTKVIHDGTYFYLCASNSTIFSRSTSGTSWSTTPLTTSQDWRAIAANGKGVVVVVGVSTTSVQYSLNSGASFASATLPASAALTAVAYGRGVFVAVEYASTNTYYSPNGENWFLGGALPAAANWTEVLYANGMFVAMGYSARAVAFSYDGLTWGRAMTPTAGAWGGLTYGFGRFWAPRQGAASVCSSEDGINWTDSSLSTALTFKGAAYLKNVAVVFVAQGPTSSAVALLGNSTKFQLPKLDTDPPTYIRATA